MAKQLPVSWANRLHEWRREFERKLTPFMREKLANVQIETRISPTLRAMAGYCLAQAGGLTYRICLSRLLYEDEAYDTFGHELAHVVTSLVYGRLPKWKAHDSEWKGVARQLGITETALMSVPQSGDDLRARYNRLYGGE